MRPTWGVVPQWLSTLLLETGVKAQGFKLADWPMSPRVILCPPRLLATGMYPSTQFFTLRILTQTLALSVRVSFMTPHSALGLFFFTILTLTFLVSSTLLSVTGFGHGENRCPGGPFSCFFRSSVFPSLCNALMIGLHFFRPLPSHPRRPFLSVAGNIPAAPHPCHQTASPKGQYIHSKFSFCCGEIHIA